MRDKSWNTAAVGHRVERLLLGDVRGSFYSSTVLQIGKFRVLVTSEVDGTSPREIDEISPLRTMDRVVEIKSSKKGIGTVLSNQGLPVQLTCNGSKHLAVVTVGVDHFPFPCAAPCGLYLLTT